MFLNKLSKSFLYAVGGILKLYTCSSKFYPTKISVKDIQVCMFLLHIFDVV